MGLGLTLSFHVIVLYVKCEPVTGQTSYQAGREGKFLIKFFDRPGVAGAVLQTAS